MDLKDFATLVGIFIAVVTFARGVYEYSRQVTTRRAEYFFQLRQRFKSNDTFRKIIDLLEGDQEGLLAIPYEDKRDFLGFFEEIALAVNSNLLRKEVAHYMFGYYAILCWNSRNFWRERDSEEDTIQRDSPYWKLFRHFAEQMIEIDKNFGDSVEQLSF